MSFVRRSAFTFLFAVATVAAIAAPAALAAPFDAGLRFGAQAGEKDFERPIFPGAQLQRDDKEDKAADGKPLVCQGLAAKSDKPKDKGRDAPLNCDDTRADGLVLKVGSQRKQHHVAIQRKGEQTLFQIVRIELRGD
ncbi:MAG: hypothetical protein ACK4F7_00785 [Inhella sp.]